MSIAEAVVKAVVDAYYPEALKEAGSARSRAQGGYAIAAAIGTAIVAAGVGGGLGSEREVVQVVGVLAVVAWLAAALLYSWAVSGPVDLPSAETAADKETFVRHVLDSVRAQRAAIEKRSGYAFSATVGAVIVTLAALVLALTTAAPAARSHGQIVLTKLGRDSVGTICGQRRAVVSGTVDPGALGSTFVTVAIDGRDCGDADEPVEVRFARGSIASFAAR